MFPLTYGVNAPDISKQANTIQRPDPEKDFANDLTRFYATDEATAGINRVFPHVTQNEILLLQLVLM